MARKEKQGHSEKVVESPFKDRVLNFLTSYLFVIGLFSGIISGILCCFIFSQASNLTPEIELAVISIVVNVLLGGAIVFVIQKKISNDRGVKDYFVSDINEITREYKIFLSSLMNGNLDSDKVLAWFLVMSTRLTHLEYFLGNDLNIKHLKIQEKNRKIHVLITKSVEFNDNFKSGKIAFSPATKTSILKCNKHLKHDFIRAIIKINNARVSS